MQICNNIDTNEQGVLTFTGYSTVELAEKYGTPLYLMDENKIREKMRTYKNAMEKYFGNGAAPIYASKAASFKRIYQIAAEENIGIDVVSAGEIYTALAAGYDISRAFFHGNNKTEDEIAFAIKNGIGYFVADSQSELEAINLEAKKQGKVQKILLRITPGIDTHTNKKIATGNVDSKFGMAIATGQAHDFVGMALEYDSLKLCGYHCHVGSQVFDAETFIDAVDIMMDFTLEIKEKYSFEPEILNLGGGFGVRYVASHPELDIENSIREVGEVLDAKCRELGVKKPRIMMEPGRSVVADAGMTLYTVGTVKQITKFKNYVAIDGGMTDNPRFALYDAEYTVINAKKATLPKNYRCTIVGKCCESGDIIQEDVHIAPPQKGDIIAVLTTGAYNYSMASNYNRIPKPPVVMLSDKGDYVAVKRETYEDIIRNDV
ncbi:MAG: diaminopimelate decarboxylase [Clostridia bacterium]|nr:diaminopimelate decarboxylase [Clostridia bacterium]